MKLLSYPLYNNLTEDQKRLFSVIPLMINLHLDDNVAHTPTNTVKQNFNIFSVFLIEIYIYLFFAPLILFGSDHFYRNILRFLKDKHASEEILKQATSFRVFYQGWVM